MASAIDSLAALLQSKDRFLITTHVNPDGDGLGSELALAHFLRGLGKQTTILNHSGTPESYQWLDPTGMILRFLPERDRDAILSADVILIVDANHPERLRSLQPFIMQSQATKVVIDHHLDAHTFADVYILDEDATSTGEIVYRIITGISGSHCAPDIARSLYAAILTDTGSFRYPRTDPEIHRIAAHLIESGADPTDIFANIYENWSLGRMRLLGEILDSMKTAYDGKLVYVVATRAMFRETGTSEVETDTFTTYPMSVKGVRVGILFNELRNGVKISFRSRGDIPVNELAKEFGGNGHANAAGARLFDAPLAETVEKVIACAGKYLPGTTDHRS